MFLELLPLLRNRTVSISAAVPANGDNIVLTIMPKVTDEKAEEYGSIKDAAVKALSGALTLKARLPKSWTLDFTRRSCSMSVASSRSKVRSTRW